MATLPRGIRRIAAAAAVLALLVAVGATVVLRKSIPTPSERVGPPALPHGGDASHPALAARSGGPAGTVPRGTVNGRVIDAVTGKGIVGATVVVTSLSESSVQARATTTNDGTFVLEGLREGDYGVEVWHRYYRSPHVDYTNWEEAIGRRGAEAGPPPDGTVLRVPLPHAAGVWTLRLTQGREVRGIVVDEAGQGVGGAIVRLWGMGSLPDDFGWPTDANGNFDLRMDGVRAVGALAPGRRSRWVYIPDEPDRPLRIVLRRDATVRGEIRWSDGRPASNVQVRARAYGHSLPWVKQKTDDVSQPDAHGSFEVRLGAGAYTLSAHHELLGASQTSSTQADLHVTPGETRSGVVLTLPAPLVVSFELVDSADRPLPDESLALTATTDAAADDNQKAPPIHWATSDTLGRIRFAVLRRGEYTLTHEPVGERPVVLWQGQVPFEGVRQCRSTASPRTRFEVRAYTAAGDPIRSFVVRAASKHAMWAKHPPPRPRTKTFAQDGAAMIEVRGAPPLVLFVDQCDAHGDPVIDPLRARDVEVPNLPPDRVVRVWLATPDQVVGSVLVEEALSPPTPTGSSPYAAPDPVWRPLEGVKVELATDPDRDGHFVAARSVTTDAEGRFVFDAQRGEGFLLRAIAPTGWLADDPLTIWGDREVATLRLRRTSRLEGRLRVVGRLALPESLSLSRGTEVVYVSTSAGGNGRTPSAWRREAPIAADGRWSLDEAPMSVDLHVEVRWKVWAEAGFIPPEPLRRVRAGGPPVVIDLVPGATIRGRVRHADEAPFVPTELSSLSVHTASEELIPHGLRWGPEGHFEIVGLPATSVKLELTGRMGVSERFWRVEQWVLPGTANVEFVIPSWGAVSIEVPREGRGRAQLTVWEAGTLRLWGGNSRVEFSNNVARIEGVPADRDLVFGLVLFSEGQVATFGPLRAGGSALVNPGPPAAFYLEDTERRAKCVDATGPLYAIAPSATWPLDADCFRPPLGNNRFGRSVGPPPGRYDLVELLPDGKTTVLVRDIEARVPPRDPNEDDDR